MARQDEGTAPLIQQHSQGTKDGATQRGIGAIRGGETLVICRSLPELMLATRYSMLATLAAALPRDVIF
jgi:hypothetical protein